LKKVIWLFLLLPLSGTSQNLVPNYSFETYDTCPNYFSQITYSLGWFNANTGTADYYNACIPSVQIANMGVPNNDVGHQNAFNGQAYAGLLLYEYSATPGWDSREYLQVQLLNPLIGGQKYFVSFLVSCSDSSFYATDDLGVYFSNTPISQSDYLNIPVIPQISNTDGDIIADTTNWTHIRKSFIASGGEQYMVIGNFNNDSNTDTIKIRTGSSMINAAYYYFDSFCVSTDSTYCDVLNSITVQNLSTNVSIFPNPVTNLLNISGLSFENAHISIYSMSGSMVFTTNTQGLDNISIDVSKLCDGLYTLSINSRLFIEKRIISKTK
jgi:hypothetical protein